MKAELWEVKEDVQVLKEEAMKSNSEVETLSIKVHKLESDMKMVKAKIGCA